jgi:hypothetical protein
MAKRKTPDPNQMTFEFDFEKRVDAYTEAAIQIYEALDERPPEPVESEFEACVEIAAAIKRCIRQTRFSRDEIVERINAYFGRTKEGAAEEPPTCRNPLTIHMLNNYLSKPISNPIPAYYLYAIHHVTGCLAPAETIVAAEGARVATGSEIRQMTLGKLEENIAEMQRLKRELKRG